MKPSKPIYVYNLEGSLFKWANEGRPLVDFRGEKTILCHPYNAVFGKMLNRQLRSSLTDDSIGV